MADENWSELEKAPNKRSVRELKSQLKGESSRHPQLMKIMLESDGTLKARLGSETYQIIGFLNLELDNVTATTAIERIINGSGIFRR
jgi:hypothetical protein